MVGEALGARGPHTLEGQLRDDAGQPVAGARVCLDDERATLTRDDGSFTFSGVAAGLHRLTAHKGDGCSDLTLVMVQEARRTVVLTMRPGITLRVYVRGPDGPLVGASLRDGGKQVVCVTDAEGVGVVRGVGANFQMFDVTAADHAPAFLSMSLAPDTGGTIERTVTLARGAPLGGIVLAPDGSPVPDATVRIWGDWGGDTTTDASGRWRFDAVAADTYQVRASARTYAAAPAVIATTDGSTPQTDLVVRVRSGAQLTGTVRDGRGEPVPGASVEVTRTEEEFPVARSYPANPAGDFAIPGLEPGTYDVFAHDPARASPETRVVLAEGEARAIDLVVAPAAIAGVVVDGTGRPVVGAEVRVDATAVRGDVTDTDGRFDLGALPPGEYQVSARWAGADEGPRARNARVAAGVTDATIVLQPRRRSPRGSASTARRCGSSARS